MGCSVLPTSMPCAPLQTVVEAPVFFQGVLAGFADARDGLYESVGHTVDNAAQWAEGTLDQARHAIDAAGDASDGTLLYGVSRYASGYLGVAEGAALAAYGAGKGLVRLGYEGAHLASMADWVAKPGDNLQRLKTTAQAVGTLGQLASPAMWALQWDENKQLAAAVWDGATQKFQQDANAGDWAKFGGRAAGDAMLLALPFALSRTAVTATHAATTAATATTTAERAAASTAPEWIEATALRAAELQVPPLGAARIAPYAETSPIEGLRGELSFERVPDAPSVPRAAIGQEGGGGGPGGVPPPKSAAPPSATSSPSSTPPVEPLTLSDLPPDLLPPAEPVVPPSHSLPPDPHPAMSTLEDATVPTFASAADAFFPKISSAETDAFIKATQQDWFALGRDMRVANTSADVQKLAAELVAACESRMPFDVAERTLTRAPRADALAMAQLAEEGERIERAGAALDLSTATPQERAQYAAQHAAAVAANAEQQAHLANFIANTRGRQPFLGTRGIPSAQSMNRVAEPQGVEVARKTWMDIERLAQQHRELKAQAAPLSMLYEIEDQVRAMFHGMLGPELRFMRQTGVAGKPLTLEEIATEFRRWQDENGIEPLKLTTLPPKAPRHPRDAPPASTEPMPDHLPQVMAQRGLVEQTQAEIHAVELKRAELMNAARSVKDPSFKEGMNVLDDRLSELNELLWEQQKALFRLEPVRVPNSADRRVEPWNKHGGEMPLDELQQALQQHAERGNAEPVQSVPPELRELPDEMPLPAYDESPMDLGERLKNLAENLRRFLSRKD
jgi:hypothetical protein